MLPRYFGSVSFLPFGFWAGNVRNLSLRQRKGMFMEGSFEAHVTKGSCDSLIKPDSCLTPRALKQLLGALCHRWLNRSLLVRYIHRGWQNVSVSSFKFYNFITMRIIFIVYLLYASYFVYIISNPQNYSTKYHYSYFTDEAQRGTIICLCSQSKWMAYLGFWSPDLTVLSSLFCIINLCLCWIIPNSLKTSSGIPPS